VRRNAGHVIDAAAPVLARCAAVAAYDAAGLLSRGCTLRQVRTCRCPAGHQPHAHPPFGAPVHV